MVPARRATLRTRAEQDEELCNIPIFGQELVLFNHRSHARGFAWFQGASLDPTLAPYSHRSAKADFRGQRHLDFNGGAIRNCLWQIEVQPACTHILSDRL